MSITYALIPKRNMLRIPCTPSENTIHDFHNLLLNALETVLLLSYFFPIKDEFLKLPYWMVL